MLSHEELMIVLEAATAGWHGAKAQEIMLGLASLPDPRAAADWAYDIEAWAFYHARLAGRAANRVMNLFEDGRVTLV